MLKTNGKIIRKKNNKKNYKRSDFQSELKSWQWSFLLWARKLKKKLIKKLIDLKIISPENLVRERINEIDAGEKYPTVFESRVWFFLASFLFISIAVISGNISHNSSPEQVSAFSPNEPAVLGEESNNVSAKNNTNYFNSQGGSMILGESVQSCFGCITSDNIKFHAIERFNLDNNSVTSRIIDDKTIHSRDLARRLTIQYLTVDHDLTVDKIKVHEDILPIHNDSSNLGDSNHRFANLFLGGETIHIGTNESDEGEISYITANNVLQFQSEGNLSLQPTGNNVGIGTTDPSLFRLQVAGDIGPNINDTYNIGSDLYRWANVWLGGETLHLGTADADEGEISYITANNVFQLQSNGVLALQPSSGNVGIGTTAPQYRLAVNGTGYYSGDLSIIGDGSVAYAPAVSGIYLSSGADTNRHIEIVSPTSGNAYIDFTNPSVDSRGRILYNTANNSFSFYTNSAAGPQMFITSSGNVGIGTTNPKANLEVAGVSAAPVMGSPDDVSSLKIGSNNLAFGYLTGSYNWMQSYGNLPLYINQLANNTILNASSGNVGIGTTSPLARLEVKQSSAGYSNGIIVKNSTSGYTDGYIALSMYGTDIGSIQSADNAGMKTLALNPEGGNVGIGTTSPVNTLDVASNLSGAYGIYINNTSPTGNGLYVTASDNSASNYLAYFRTKITNTDAFIVKGNGKIGMGTSPSGGYVHISDNLSTSGTPALYVQSTNTGDGLQIRAGSSGGYIFDAHDKDTDTSRFIIKVSGNVGIGTTNPGAKLDVAGKVLAAESVGTTNGGYTFENDGSYDTGMFSPSDGVIDFYNNGSPKVRIDSNGNIGIGTTSSSYKLSLGSSGDQIGYYVDSTHYANIKLYDGTTGGMYFDRSTGSIGGYHFKFYGSEKMTLTDGGYLGIGITSPLAVMNISNTSPDLVLSNANATNSEVDSGTIDFLEQSRYVFGNASALGFRITYDGNENRLYVRSTQGGTVTTAMSIERDNGHIGIGTTSPTAQMHIHGANENASTGIPLFRITDTNFSNNYFSIDNGQNQDAYRLIAMTNLELQSMSNGSQLVLTTDNKVGIGTSNPGSYKIYINGTGYLNDTSWSYLSDRRLKENVEGIKYGLSAIMSLDPVSFDYINGTKNQMGFIAQDVQKIIPEILGTRPDGMMTLKTELILPIAVKAIQELASSEKEQQAQVSEILYDVSSINSDILKINDDSISMNDKIGIISKNLTDISSILSQENNDNKNLNSTLDSYKLQLDKQNSAIDALEDQLAIIEETNRSVIDFAKVFDPKLMVYKDSTGDINLTDGKITAKNIEVLNTIKAKDVVATGKVMGESIEMGTSSSGKGKIKAEDTEVKIETPAVSEDVKISVTPEGSTQGKVLYYDEIVEGKSFKVKIDKPALDEDIKFTWLIIK